MHGERAGNDHDAYVGFDGRYRFICENGHNIVSSQRTIDPHCPARPQRAVGDGTVEDIGPPCGAPVEARVIPYEECPDE